MDAIKKTFTHEVGGKTLTLEVSSLAEQANAAVVAKYGDTVVLGTAVMSAEDRDTDFMPLRVDYEERFYAGGKILGSRFMRRESRPSEDAILSGRLIDRTIRPLFDDRLRRDTQVVVTTLAIDEIEPPEFVGLAAASAALHISNIPWNGPVGGVRVAKIGGQFIVNPTEEQLASPDLTFETFAAGPKGLINMIELAGHEVPESDIEAAFAVAQKEIDNLIAFFEDVRKQIGKPKADVQMLEVPAALQKAADEFLSSRLADAVYQQNKAEMDIRIRQLEKDLIAHLTEQKIEFTPAQVALIYEKAVAKIVHDKILDEKKRPDGRAIDQIRQLSGEVGLFARTHGSALFTRGSTQSLAVTTLAAPGAEQLVETLETTQKRRFMLHYNFPPYSVGEVGPFRGAGRREIGHGALAKKALEPLIPDELAFPYTIRVVSEILSSNGSSSMATVCATTLSLLDAGVPLKKPAAGIAMGLVTDEQGRFQVLTDLQGPEDHWGDMDFKVAGTREGVTAVQLDTKVAGLRPEIVSATLTQANAARMQILDMMAKVISAPRTQLSKYAPAVVQFKIDPEKIGTLIGPGGKMINGLIKKHELDTINVEEDGTVSVASPKQDNVAAAVKEIQDLTREFKVGEIVQGPILKVLEFGGIMDLGGGNDGMIHVSEIKDGFVKSAADELKVGQVVRAKIIRVEDGRIGLSIKRLAEHG
jgi:polyribonucleotide nucleotidyltransferase